MGILGWILLGLLAGLIARAVVKGPAPGGLILTTLLGVVGALLGGGIVKALGYGDPIDEFFDVSTWAAAIGGAILILWIYGLFASRSRGRRLSLR